MKTQSSAASAHPTLFGFKIGYFVFAFVTIFVAGFVYAYPRTIEVRDTQNYGVPFTADARLILRDRDSSQIFYKEFSKVKLDSKGYLISYTPDWFELPRHLIADVCFKRGDTDAKGELTSVPYCEGAVAPANYKGYVIRSCENRLIPWNLVSLTRTVEFSGLCNAKGQDIAMAVTNNAGDIVPVVAGDKDTDIDNDTNIDNGTDIDNDTNNASNVSWIVTNPTQTVTNNNTVDMQDCEDDEVLVWDNGQWNCRDVDDLVTNGTGGTPALPQNNIFVGDATNTATPYAPGANGDVLSIVGGTPTWTTFSGGVATNNFSLSRAAGYTSDVNGVIGTQAVPVGTVQEVMGFNAGGAPVYQSVAGLLSGNTTNTVTLGAGNLTTTVNGVVSNLSLTSLFANPNGGNLTGPGPIVVTGGAGAVLGAGATVDCPTCITTTSTGLTGDLIAGSNVVFAGSGVDKLVGATNVTVGISATPTFDSITTTVGPNNFAGTTNTATLNTTGTFTASGPVSFTGPTFTTSAGTTSTFNGPTNIAGNLTTSGTVINNGPVTNNGTTTLNGATTVNNSFTTTGPNNLGGNTTVNNLTVTGTFTIPPASTGDVVAGTGVTLTGISADRLVGASNLTIGIDPATIAVTATNSITGNGATGTPLQLSGDVAAPGNNFFYGTSGAGVKGWQNLATAIAGATTNTNALTQAGGLVNTVNGVTATTAIPTGFVNQILGYDLSGDPVYQSPTAVLANWTTNTLGSVGNTMTSTVNGVVANAIIINNNGLSVGGGNLTSTVNGIVSNLPLTSLFAAATGGDLTGPGPIVVSGGVGSVLGTGTSIDCPTCITTATLSGATTNVKTWDRATGLTDTVNGVAANVTPGAGVIQEILGYNAAGAPVFQTPAAVLSGLTTHTSAWTEAAGLQTTVNGVTATLATPVGTIANVIGYDAAGNPVRQTAASLVAGANSFILVGDTGTAQTINSGDTMNILGGGPITTVASGTDIVTVNCPTCITTTSTGLTGDLIAGSNVVFAGSGVDKLVGATNVTVGISATPTFDSITTTVGPNNFAGTTNTATLNTTGTFTASGPVSFTGPTFTTSAGTTSTFNGPTNIAGNLTTSGTVINNGPVTNNGTTTLNGVTNVTNTLNTTGPNNFGGTTTIDNLNVTGTTTFTTLPNLPLPLGNIFVGNGAGNAQAYAPGANGDLLQVVGGIPTWSTAASVLAGATTNTLGSAVNTMTSTVNGVVATAPIVNSVSNTSTTNSLSTTVNGVVGATVPIINSNVIGWNQATGITSTVNGISATVPNPAGVISALLGFDALGNPVNQTVASVLTAATCPVAGTFACQNGNTYGANAVYGTNDAFALNFETNNTVRGGFAANGDFNVDTNTLFVDSINNRVGVGTAAPVAGFQNASSTLFGTGALGNFAAGGAIGAAAATVDAFTSLNIGQTTAGQTLTIPAPTNTTAGRILYVQNNGSQSFNMLGAGVAAGGSIQAIWNGTAWVRTGGASGAGVPINTLQNSTGSGSLQVAAADTLNWDFLNTTANAMTMNFLAQTSGNGLTINSFNTPTSGSAFLVNSTSNGNLANGAARINLTGNHTGAGFVIDDASNAAGATAMEINMPNNVGGNGLAITGAVTTGDLLNVTAPAGAYATDGVVDFTFGAHTGVGVGINSGASSGTALHVNTVGLNGGSAIQITTPQNESALTMVDVSNAEQVAIVNGIADPNGTVNKPNGSMYFRTSAGNQGWYMNTSAGAGGTVWTLIAGPTGTNNIYTSNGTLTGNRTLTHGGFDLTFDGSAQDVVFDTTGQLLVNTTTPVAGKVAVFNGDIDVTGAIDPNAILFSDGVAGAFTPSAVGGYKIGHAAGVGANRPIFMTTLANQTNAFQVRQADDTTVVFNVDNLNSRVGIGTGITPTAQLTLGNTGGAGTGIAFDGVATGTPNVSAANQGRIFFNSTTDTFQCSSNGGAYTNCLGAAAGTALSSITAATATNTIANSAFAQTWGWNGLSGTDSGLTLSGASSTGSGAILAIDMTTGGGTTSAFRIDAQTTGFASRISNVNGGVAAFYDNGLTDTTFMGIDASGGVFMGTNTPLSTNKLSVVQDSALDNVLGLATPDSTTAGYFNQFGLVQASPEGTYNGTRGDLALFNNGTEGRLYLKTSGAASSTGWTQLATTATGTGVPISALAPALADNTIDNTNFQQQWNWSTLTAGIGLQVTSPTLTTGDIFRVNSTGVSTTGNAINALVAGGTAFRATATTGSAFQGNTNSTTTAAMQITNTGTAPAFSAGANVTTNNVASMSSNTVTTGSILTLQASTGAAYNSAAGVLFVDAGSTGSTNGNAMTVNTSGALTSFQVRNNGNVGISTSGAAVSSQLELGAAGTRTGLTFEGVASATPGLSGVNEGRMFYDTTLDTFRCSTEGNAYGSCLTSMGGVALSSLTGATAANNINHTAFQQDWSWNGLTTGAGMRFTSSAAFSGNLVNISGSANHTGSLFNVNSTSTGAFANGGVDIVFASAHTGSALSVRSGTVSGNAQSINALSATTGNALDITANTLTTGTALRITSTSARTGSGAAGTIGSGLLSIQDSASNGETISMTDSTNTCTLNPGATLGVTCTSDASLKKNIANADSILDAINQIQIRKYDWKSDDTHARYGVVAQEVAGTDMGYLVTTDPETGLKGVAQVDPWMLVKGLQEVDAKTVVTAAEVEALAAANATQDAATATLESAIANINTTNATVEEQLALLNTNDQNFLAEFSSLLDSVTVQQDSINDLLATLSDLSLDVAALTGRVDALEAAVAALGNGSEANVVGRAEINEGDTVVHVTFDTAFDSKPVITLAPNAFVNGKYALDNVDKNGFDIKLSVEQDGDVSFDWHAFKSVNVSSSNSTGGNGGSNDDDNSGSTEGDDTPETPVTPPADETPTEDTPAADDTEMPADDTPAPDEGSNDEAPADDAVIPTGI